MQTLFYAETFGALNCYVANRASGALWQCLQSLAVLGLLVFFLDLKGGGWVDPACYGPLLSWAHPDLLWIVQSIDLVIPAYVHAPLLFPFFFPPSTLVCMFSAYLSVGVFL